MMAVKYLEVEQRVPKKVDVDCHCAHSYCPCVVRYYYTSFYLSPKLPPILLVSFHYFITVHTLSEINMAYPEIPRISRPITLTKDVVLNQMRLAKND